MFKFIRNISLLTIVIGSFVSCDSKNKNLETPNAIGLLTSYNWKIDRMVYANSTDTLTTENYFEFGNTFIQFIDGTDAPKYVMTTTPYYYQPITDLNDPNTILYSLDSGKWGISAKLDTIDFIPFNTEIVTKKWAVINDISTLDTLSEKNLVVKELLLDTINEPNQWTYIRTIFLKSR